MNISFNTGATVDDANTLTVSQTVTVPAGVNAGDVVLLVVTGWAGANATETIQASSTGTTPTIIGTTESVTFSATNLQGAIFYFVAKASDAGKVITVSFVSGDTAKWSIALGAWTGVSNASPIDTSGGTTASGLRVPVTCPTESGNPADWCVELVALAVQGSAFIGPASGFTQREAVVDANSGGGATIWDSNAPAGSPMGGATFSNTGGNSWWAGFTVGLAPAGGGGTVSPMIAREVMADITQTATYQVVYEDELLWE